VLVLLVAGCGRVGFDAGAPDVMHDGQTSGGDGTVTSDVMTATIDSASLTAGDHCTSPATLTRGSTIMLDTCAAIDDSLMCGPAGTRDVFFELIHDGLAITVTATAGYAMTALGPSAQCSAPTLNCQNPETSSSSTPRTYGVEKTDGSCGVVTITAI
jgi:hypothetical protein